MPPYWDNKALPTPTLTLPDTFIFNFLIISFILLKINDFSMRYEIWKGRKKRIVIAIMSILWIIYILYIIQKAGSNSG